MNALQNDYLLDLYEQCLLVTQTFDQISAHRGRSPEKNKETEFKAIEKALLGKFQEAVTMVCDLWHIASSNGVPEETLDCVISKFLPPTITFINGEAKF